MKYEQRLLYFADASVPGALAVEFVFRGPGSSLSNQQAARPHSCHAGRERVLHQTAGDIFPRQCSSE